MTDDRAPAAPARLPLKQRLSALFEEYGRIAIITYFTLSILTIIGFSIAIWMGVEPSTETGILGVLIAGWVLAKATMPIRIPITLALTPVIAMVVRRFWPPQPADDDADDGDAADSSPPSSSSGEPPAPPAPQSPHSGAP
jgi:hypothetical protein